MKKINIGIQLYTLRETTQTTEGFDETLSFLENLGVNLIQISKIGKIPANIQASILKKHNMKVCVTHKTGEELISNPEQLISDHKKIGCDTIGIGSLPIECRDNFEEFDKFMTKLVALEPLFKKYNMFVAYHNHAFEFSPFHNGKSIMDLIIERTNPDFLHFIPDVCWLQIAGINPSKHLIRVKDRISTVHFKDYVKFDQIEHKPTYATLGEGVMEFDEIYKTCQNIGVEYIVYEQDNDFENNNPRINTEKSWRFLQELKEKMEL